jgi:hypothetical protein
MTPKRILFNNEKLNKSIKGTVEGFGSSSFEQATSNGLEEQATSDLLAPSKLCLIFFNLKFRISTYWNKIVLHPIMFS